MKLLETTFVCNYDKRGDNKFVQVKRNEFAAIYQRFDMEGHPLEFEVFQVKVAGGNEIFGRHYDEYEQYPGAAAFGKTAWTTNTLERAEQIFDEITKGQGNRKDGKAVDQPVVVKVKKTGGKRGRPRVERPAIVFPKKKFCMKELVKLNTNGWSQPTLYIELMKLVKQNKAEEAERVQQGRGRATVFYRVKA